MEWLYRVVALLIWLFVAAFLMWIDYGNRYHNTPTRFCPKISTFIIRYVYPDYRRTEKKPPRTEGRTERKKKPSRPVRPKN